MRDAWPRLREAGAELVVIGNGAPYQAAGFRDDERLEFRLLVDPELRAYKALGLRRSVLGNLRPRLASNTIRAMRKGFRQTRVEGDAFQLGGVYVVAPGGAVTFAFQASVAGDMAPPAAVLAAVEALSA